CPEHPLWFISQALSEQKNASGRCLLFAARKVRVPPAAARGCARGVLKQGRRGETAVLRSNFASWFKHFSGHIEAALQLSAAVPPGGFGGWRATRQPRHATRAL